jgi:hypothetical protein
MGGFDESLPFLEDQRIADKIREQGKFITLPGYLKTSARRFEAEGFHRRYILMAMMMGLRAVGVEEIFHRAPGIYRVQQDSKTLLLTPYFCLVWRMIRGEWRIRGTARVFYQAGRYTRQNSWQVFFFIDVWLRSWLGNGSYPFLSFHDRVFGHRIRCRVLDALAGIVCFIWFMGMLAPYFWCADHLDKTLYKLKK